ncbi:MAG TPA: neutral zinc metallopeptidase, partial [Candidatus Lustribacter sp.]|nr:neutral zinc metallopeptidase [Candidatus Lustribacter sp.]
MSFTENVQLDTSRIESGGGGRGLAGIKVGGGIGGVIVMVVVVLFQVLGNGGGGSGGTLPIDAAQYDASRVAAGGQVDPAAFSQCRTGADANRDDVCRIIATVNSAERFWAEELPRRGLRFRPAQTVIYDGTTQSACGTASNQVGPFYCPLDEKIYIDASFFAELTSRFGADDGALAKEYVVAHEYGHHIQNILDILGRAQQDPQGPESGAVRIELMADCLGGMWVKNATTTTDAQGVT